MRICVVGVGNIGMRYVQGISKTFPDAQLLLVDAPARLRDIEKMALDNTRLLESLDQVDGSVDLCVVATSCQPRLSLYQRCLALNPRYVILEKYLFKSRQEFEQCLALHGCPTFVNQWMYGSGTFDCMFEEGASEVELIGSDWGLACNAVHWIDVFKRHMHLRDLRVGPDTRDHREFPQQKGRLR